LACTTSRRLSVVDVERGEQLLAYDNCAASGRDRTGLATDPTSPNIAVSVAVNGRGLTLLDLRMPLPLDYLYDVSSCKNNFGISCKRNFISSFKIVTCTIFYFSYILALFEI